MKLWRDEVEDWHYREDPEIWGLVAFEDDFQGRVFR